MHTRVLALFRVAVDDRDGELRKVVPARQELLVVGDAEEEGEVVADVAALRVDEDVPAAMLARSQAHTLARNAAAQRYVATTRALERCAASAGWWTP